MNLKTKILHCRSTDQLKITPAVKTQKGDHALPNAES